MVAPTETTYGEVMGTCESCGRTGEATTKVQRMYLLPPEGFEGPAEQLESVVTPAPGDIEWWCASCAATFLHVPLPAEDPPEAAATAG